MELYKVRDRLYFSSQREEEKAAKELAAVENKLRRREEVETKSFQGGNTKRQRPGEEPFNYSILLWRT